MSPEEIFPRCPSTPFRRGRDTMPLQNVGDRVTWQFVTQVGQGTLHSQITPGLVFRSETDNERGNLNRRPRASRCTVRTAVVFLGNQLPMPSQQRCRRDDYRDMLQNFPAE